MSTGTKLPAGRLRAAGFVRAANLWLTRWTRRARSAWIDIAWVLFALANLGAMRLIPNWQTVPFLVIWVSLTLVYGIRLWQVQPAILTALAVTVATGSLIAMEVIKGQQDPDYLAEVPLVALMFLVMMWQGRRRLEAIQGRLAALEQVQMVSAENVRLLEQQRLYLLDASHELGTPITVALGHAELLEQSVAGTEAADDARVVVGELARLRRLAGRLLLLAAAQNPGFLNLVPVPADSVIIDAVDRWAYAQRHWRLGDLAEVTITADGDRLATAMDALLENAVAHTDMDDTIELSARLVNGHVVFAVKDSGSGIPVEDLERVFGRFARAKPYRSRQVGGFGLGLPVVQAITEAHHGTVQVTSIAGQGSTFEVVIPTSQPPEPQTASESVGAVATLHRKSSGFLGLSPQKPGTFPGVARSGPAKVAKRVNLRRYRPRSRAGRWRLARQQVLGAQRDPAGAAVARGSATAAGAAAWRLRDLVRR